MTSVFGRWVISVIGASVVSAVLASIVPESRTKRTVRLACGMLVVSALVSFIPDLSLRELREKYQRYEEEAEDYTAGVKNENKRFLRIIMEEECAAYISDKAELYGLNSLSAEFTFEWNEGGWWRPTAVSIVMDEAPSVNAKQKLSDDIEKELGIAPERQSWSVHERNH